MSALFLPLTKAFIMVFLFGVAACQIDKNNRQKDDKREMRNEHTTL